MKEIYELTINKKRWEALKELRGWTETKLAYKMGMSKSMINKALNGGIAIGHEFMLTYIKVTGNNPNDPIEWSRLFEIRKKAVGERLGERSFQKDNYLKYKDLVPYKADSLIGKSRKEDQAKNLERLKMPQPIPAEDYYDNAIPRRCYVKNRYKR